MRLQLGVVWSLAASCVPSPAHPPPERASAQTAEATASAAPVPSASATAIAVPAKATTVDPTVRTTVVDHEPDIEDIAVGGDDIVWPRMSRRGIEIIKVSKRELRAPADVRQIPHRLHGMIGSSDALDDIAASAAGVLVQRQFSPDGEQVHHRAELLTAGAEPTLLAEDVAGIAADPSGWYWITEAAMTTVPTPPGMIASATVGGKPVPATLTMMQQQAPERVFRLPPGETVPTCLGDAPGAAGAFGTTLALGGRYVAFPSFRRGDEHPAPEIVWVAKSSAADRKTAACRKWNELGLGIPVFAADDADGFLAGYQAGRTTVLRCPSVGKDCTVIGSFDGALSLPLVLAGERLFYALAEGKATGGGEDRVVIFRMPRSGGPPEPVARVAGEVGDLAADGEFLYWTVPQKGIVERIGLSRVDTD
ncbi:MAG: hypothetical protein V1750_03975 [Acidobacteriota bacterium]